MTKRRILWLLAVAVAAVEIGFMIWTLRPRKIAERLPPPEQPVQRVHLCSYGGICWWHPSPPPQYDPGPPRKIETHVKAQDRVEVPRPPPNEVRRYTVCAIAGAENCWMTPR
jgi:hypothetical protein